MRKAVKIAVVLVLVAICIVATAGFVIRSGKKGNPSPESINMGSAGSMGPMPPAARTSEQPESKEAKSPANTVSVDDLGLAPSDAPVKSFTITAEVVKKAGQSELWTYNGTVPGPEIRVTEGDHVHVTLINHLPVPTSIHWHGVAVPNRSDGVAGLTQDAVKPGQSYTYDFIAAEPGTYWYHSHTNTFEQEPRGLFAALIIEPRNRSRYDHDYTLVYFDDYNKSQTAGQIVWQRIQQSFGREVPPPVMVNGKEEEKLEAARGQTVRVRIINASAGDMQGTPLRIVPLGVPFQVVALDGHDIHQPQTLSSEVLSIGQGQRYDLVFTVPSSGIVEVVNAFSGQVTSIGQGNLSIPKNLNDLPIFDLTSSGVPVLSALAPDARFDANYTVTLGSKPGFRFGQIELIHTMNGGAFPDSPTLVVEKGQMVHVRLENKSAEYHPIHLHGHVLTVLRVNDRPVTGSPVRQDTVLVYPHQTADVAFVADNPGLWMMHCHVLIHANFGMDMMVVYPNISTPYTIGTKSGNFPD